MMTERAWLEGLAARGITFTERNGRLRCHPERAYKTLSDEEIIFLRHHRAEIRDALRAGPSLGGSGMGPPNTPPESEGVLAPTPAPAPICRYCMRACVGREHPAFAVLHGRDEQEQWRMGAEQSEKDYREWELRQRYGLPSPTWEW